MAEKRKFEEYVEIDENKQFKSEFGKNHTLDSDESDESEKEEVMNEDDRDEGAEEGSSFIEDQSEIKFTPFNLKEEMEEGHFDADGHYQFHKEANIRDNWLDNIDWIKVKKDSNYKEKYNATEDSILSSSSSEDEEEKVKKANFDLLRSYKEILTFMESKETVKKTLQRLGKNKPKLTTAQRWKMKKSGIVDNSAENILKLTELADDILTQTGNMDIYEMTFETISSRVKEMEDKKAASTSKQVSDDLDMYSDEFDTKEKDKLQGTSKFKIPATVSFKENEIKEKLVAQEESKSDEVMWEYKMKLDDDEILGPFTSQQMQKKVDDGEFKKNVFVRKVVKNRTSEQDAKFYSSSRIDFDLYI